MSVLRRGIIGTCVAALVATALPASAGPPMGEPSRAGIDCVDDSADAHRLNMKVDGEMATGHYALPSSDPRAIAVFAHGYGHTSYSWVHHMKRVAKDLGIVAVTMDYRGIQMSPDSNGDGLPESRGWNAMKGAEDLIAAAELFERNCTTARRTVLMGVSMGGNMSGLALALARKTPENPLFDHWIDVEGATNITETYLSARILAPVNAYAKRAQEDIEAEMGGPIEQNPDAYRDRTVVARIEDIKASGVNGVTVIHGLDDGLVPYNQGREMATMLLQAQIPTDMFTVGRRSKNSEKETTATGYVGDPVFGAGGQEYKSPFAGHASEKSTTHIIMIKAFERLAKTVKGYQPTGYNENFVDGEEGTFGTTP